jgi:glycosyltransferase involved in cell wall biosynthesis
MRILMVSEYFSPFTPGGGEWSTMAWARILVKKGHSVCVATVNFGAAYHDMVDRIEVYRLPFPFKLPIGQFSVTTFKTKNPLFYMYFGIFLSRLAKRFDIIHAQSENAIIPALLASWLSGKPAVMTLRDTGLLCPLGGVCLTAYRVVPTDCGVKRLFNLDAQYFQKHYLRHQHLMSRIKLSAEFILLWVDNWLKRICLNRMHAIIAVSNGIAEVHPSNVLWARNKVRVVYNPYLPMERPDREPDEIKKELGVLGKPIVLSVGKKSLGKGTYVLIEASKLLYKIDPTIAIIIAGKGHIREKISPNVIALPSMSHIRMAELYSVADVIVVPSIWPEPLSRVILEAMGARKPVIGTWVGGTPEAILDGITGMLVPAGDAVALKDAIERLLHDPKLCREMGEAGWRRVTEQFSPEKLVRRILEVYGQTIKMFSSRASRPC